MKKVLIIGGTGTISAPVVHGLALRDDIELYVLNRGNRNEELPKEVHLLVGDIKKNPEQVRKLTEKMHFDSVISFITMNIDDAKVNYELWKEITGQFIFISTICVLNRDLSCNVNESMETGNKNYLYGRQKEECEKYFLEKCRDEGFPVTIVRPTQTYSDARIPLSVKGRGCWSVVSRMLAGKEVIVHDGGQSVWAGTHAKDFAKGFIPLVANPKTIGEIYQVMNPESYTWNMLYETLADLLHVEYKPVYISTDLLKHCRKYDFAGSIGGDKAYSVIFDITKLKEIVPDFKCDIGLREGLRMYVDYMEKHPELRTEEPEFDKWCDSTIAKYDEMAKKFIEVV